jgi:hypothetical protein
VLVMDSVYWDSKGCTATVTMRNTTPGGWHRQAAARMADVFWRVGGCHNLFVEKPGCAAWEFESPEPDLDALEFVDVLAKAIPAGRVQ